MTTPSGTIGLSDVNAELGYSPTALITMNDSAVRTLAGVGGAGTVISMQNLQGKSNRVAIALTVSSPAANYDVYSNRGPTYDPGKSDITLTINAPAVVYSTSTGSSALVVPSAFNPGDTVTIVNNGVILGAGGNGGHGLRGGDSSSNPNGPKNANSGGPALSVSRSVSINNANRIAGGGGGGGGGSGATGFIGPPDNNNPSAHGGGGGGGGIGNGSAGTGGQALFGAPQYNYPGANGNAGTLTAAGTGGTGGASFPGTPGGPAGSYGSSGTAGSSSAQGSAYYGGNGGSGGAAVNGNPYITWIATGTRNGPIS